MAFNFVDSRPVVVIYKDKLLTLSQTFVRAQAEALQQYVPVYAGARCETESLSLPEGRWTVINQNTWRGRVGEFAFYLAGWSPKLVRELRQVNPVLVHCHFGVDSIRGMYLAKKLGVPLLVTFHGYDATINPEFAPDYRYREYIRKRPLLSRRATRFITVSNYLRQRLLDQGFPAEKIITHYIGIDTEFFKADPDVAREPVVLFVGRLVEKKGCEYVIRAMSELRVNHPAARLVVIGDGVLRGKLQQLAQQLCPNTIFLRAQSPQQVRHWMNRASVFCVPSLTARNGDQEGFGLVFAEAQAMGLPVVSFDSAGVPEAVENGVTGFLLPERDHEGLASSISMFLSNRELWQKVSSAGVARVRSRFNLRTQTRLLEDIYSSMIGKAPARVEQQHQELEAATGVRAS